MTEQQSTNRSLAITDSAERNRAIDPLRSCIVQAPAGSGKTTLLSQRYVALLAGVEQPEQILAITFTKKAAAEMRLRIREELADTNSALGAAAMARSADKGWGLADYPSRLRIQTIDAFAMSLVKQLPITSKLQQRDICDHPAEYYQRAVARVVQRVAQPDDTGVASGLIRDFDGNITQVQNLLITMLARREQWLFSLTDKLANFSADALVDAISEGIQELQTDALTGLLNNISLPARHALQSFAHYASDQLGTEAPFSELPEFEQWRFIANKLVLVASATLDEPTARKALNKNNGFPPTKDNDHKQQLLLLLKEFAAGQQHADMLQALTAIRDIPDLDAATRDRDRITLMGTMLLNCVAELNDLFDQGGEVDYNQITIAAITALGSEAAPSELAMSLDYRISHLLIDEFQDTSRAQHTLFERLVSEWTPADNTTFFAVGDPMQSIYRFRNAEVSLFLDVCNNGIGNLPLEHLSLSTNFRSSDPMISWFNAVFSNVLGNRDDTNLGRIRYASATSPRGELGALLREQLLEPLQLSAAVVEQHEQIVAHIQNLADRKSCALTDIAILVRNRTPVASLVRALEGAGIAWQGTELYGLAESAIVSDLVALASTLFDPADRLSAFALLRSPLVGLNLADLFALATCFDDTQQAEHTNLVELLQQSCQTETLAPLPGISEAGRQRLQRLFAAARLPLQHRLQSAPRELIESIWLQLGGPAAYPDNQLKHAERLLDTIEQGHPIHFSPSRLQQDLQKLYAEDDGAGVQILTIHKSKGLQFKHVLLPHTEAGTRADDAALILQRSSNQGALLACKAADHNANFDKQNRTVYHWLKVEDAQRARNETRRVLYVAATRAEESLTLFASLPEDKSAPIKGSLLACLSGVYGELWEDREAIAPEADPKAPTSKTSDNSGSPADTHILDQEEEPDAVIKALPATLQPPTLPAPAVNLPARSRNIAGRRELDEPDLLFARERRAAILRGNLTHQSLCALTQARDDAGHTTPTGSADAATANQQRLTDLIANEQHLWMQQALHLGLDEEQAQQLIAAVAQQLEQTVNSELGQWCALLPHTDSQAELGLTLWENAGPLALVVDRMFVVERTKQQSERWIIDYKTATPAASGATTNGANPDTTSQSAYTDNWLGDELNRYSSQLARYARAVRAMHPDQTIRTALYFTATDQLWETGQNLASQAGETKHVELDDGSFAYQRTFAELTETSV